MSPNPSTDQPPPTPTTSCAPDSLFHHHLRCPSSPCPIPLPLHLCPFLLPSSFFPSILLPRPLPLSPLHSRASVSHHQRRQPPPSSRTSTASSNNPSSEADPNSYGGDTVTGQNRKFCLPPLTPRSQQSSKSRSSLPPLQPLLIARRSLDEWPQASSDDIGEWLPPQLPLSPGDGMRGNPGERLKLDLSSIQMNNDRNCNNGSNSVNKMVGCLCTVVKLVKAARCIADPNMGFACQLLQCQKRVHTVPLSPTSLLRMYRMDPHSPYGPLHLVPKMKVDCYDVDYEVFQKTIVGGFVPPFPSSENEHETHLPARESSWSALRRKVSSSHMKEIVTAPKSSLPRVYSDSMLCIHSTKTSSPSSSSSPSYISPDSVSSSSYISPWKEGAKEEEWKGKRTKEEEKAEKFETGLGEVTKTASFLSPGTYMSCYKMLHATWPPLRPPQCHLCQLILFRLVQTTEFNGRT
ncbi:Protein-tyrosine-phosphatase [Arachis hypogaea]|nr:Protein-tyrosine-phosphatase [Arachis hypogaea]